MKKKWIAVVLLSIAALLFLGLFLARRLVETRIQETAIVPNRIHQLEEKTGFVLHHGALRFEFLRGMVLTGVQISERDAKGVETPLLSGGQAVLGFPFLSVFAAEPAPYRLTIHDGHLHLKSVSARKAPAERITTLIQFLKQVGLDLQLSNLLIEDLEDDKDLSARDLRLSLSIAVREREQASLHGELQYQDHSVLHIDSTWKEADQERIFLHVKDMPVRLPHIWTGEFPYLPDGVELTLKDGEMNGEGSIDLTKEGYAFHLRGGYENTSLTIPGISRFAAKGLSGEYEQTVVGSFAKGLLHSNLQLKGDLLDHTTEINADQANHLVKYHFIGSLRLKPGPNLTLPLPVTMDLDYDVGLEKKSLRDREAMHLSVDAKLKKLIMTSPEGWPSLPTITVENGVFKGDGPIGFALPGTIGSTEFQLGGRIVPDLYRIQGETFFKHNTEFSLDIKQGSLHEIIGKIGAVAEDLQKYVNGPDAVRAEDSGPVWENKFITHPIYRHYVEPAIITGTIRLLQLTESSPDMPRSLNLQFRHRVPATELLLQPVATDTTHIDAHYRVLYDAMLPQHEAKLELRYTGNGYTNRDLCNENSRVDPVHSVDLRYNFQAEGMYLADLYFKSVTGLYLNVKHLPAEQDYRVDLLRRLAEVDRTGLRYIDLDIQRNSAGSLFKPIIIKAEDDQVSLVGNGEFNVYEGGFLQFQYFLKKATKQGRFQVRIRPDRVWIPSS